MSENLCTSLFFAFITIGLISCRDTEFVQGARIYETRCLNCHMSDGSGLAPLYPNLAGSNIVSQGGANLACIIINGQNSSRIATIEMPGNSDLTPAELSNLLNYINHKWGNQKTETPRAIAQYIADCNIR